MLAQVRLGRRRRPFARARTTRCVTGVVVTVTALSGLAQLFARAGFSVRGCIEANGIAGWLGMRLMLLHTTNACPAGTMAAGPSDTGLLTVLGCVTLVALVAHAGAVAVAWGAAIKVSRILAVIARVSSPRRIAALVVAAFKPRGDTLPARPVFATIFVPRLSPRRTPRALRAPPALAC